MHERAFSKAQRMGGNATQERAAGGSKAIHAIEEGNRGRRGSSLEAGQPGRRKITEPRFVALKTTRNVP